jgi:hypothetical protein
MLEPNSIDKYVSLGEFCQNRIPKELDCKIGILNIFDSNTHFYYRLTSHPLLNILSMLSPDVVNIDNNNDTITIYDQNWLSTFTDLAEKYQEYSKKIVSIYVHIFHPDPKK